MVMQQGHGPVTCQYYVLLQPAIHACHKYSILGVVQAQFTPVLLLIHRGRQQNIDLG